MAIFPNFKVATMKSRLEEFLPRVEDIPTTKKDSHRADWFIAHAKLGFFATQETAKLASSNRNLYIQNYKKNARMDWIQNHIKVIDELNESRAQLPDTPLQDSQLDGVLGFR